jgi:hypothetical protein
MLGNSSELQAVRVVEAAPALIPTIAFESAPEVQNASGTGLGPEHTRVFEALTNDGLAASFHHARTVKESSLAIGPIEHPMLMMLEVSDLAGDILVGSGAQILKTSSG